MKKTIGSRPGPKSRPVEERFWEKVGPHDDPTKCWLWLAATIKSNHGGATYGCFRIGKKMVLAHRLSYEMHYHVTIPEGMTIDHVKVRGCTSTLCVNPHHLEVVTSRVNTLRGVTVAAKEAQQIYCVRGHPFNKENTYVYPDGGRRGRRCRVCHRERNREYLVKKKAAV